MAVSDWSSDLASAGNPAGAGHTNKKETADKQQMLTVQIAQETVAAVHRDRHLYLIIALFWLAGFGYLSFVGQAKSSFFFIYFDTLFPQFTTVLLPLLTVYSIAKILIRKVARLSLAFKLLLSPRNISRVISGLVLLAGVCLSLGMFTAVKTSFGYTYGFVHDIWQADLDKLLFLGIDPWHVLFSPMHSVWLQIVVEANYNIFWHIINFATVFFFAVSSSRSQIRTHYLASFLLTWIIVGNVFAGIFISGGPAFYGSITGDEARFGEQLEALAQYKDSTAIFFQEILWNSYLSERSGFGTGISAFPSMHIAMTVLNLIFAYSYNRILGHAATAYSLFVLWSSVYLAWHYLIDGLFSAIAVVMIYWAVKKLIERTKPGALIAS